MQTVVGVRFKKAGKIYYFAPGEFVLVAGNFVIVETARGLEYGEVVIGPREVADENIVAPLKTVQRQATPEDDKKVNENRAKEKDAFSICEQKIKAHDLNMKLVDVEYTFDVNKIIFYFTAEGRIDFRELVKDLAAVFRTRIELRQIGVRDEAKMMGGVGCCGRSLCCSTFLGDFEPVSIRMAKDQNLSLNPTKISGICGRLMCCLKYENDSYSPCCKKITAPIVGREVVTIDGDGKVTSVNQAKRTAAVLLKNNNIVVIPWEEVVEKDNNV
ncbi:stage 0 sporulation family protein [Pelosinus sp. sgz500959]|uniref:PSP1 domain-containing protein n=1 Tax=Pelosinus sp. sgz500959 TaxID=3242472 RepID=UPI00366F459B